MTKLKLKSLLFITLFLITISIVFLVKSKKGRKEDRLPISLTSNKQEEKILELKKAETYFFDLEKNENLDNIQTLGNWKSYSGNRSSKLDSLNEYSVTYKKKLGELSDLKNLKQVIFSLKNYTDNNIKEATTVLSIDGPDGKNIVWLGLPMACKKLNWTSEEYKYEIPENALNPDNTLKIYVWNKSKQQFYIDDLEITYFKLLNVAPEQENNIVEKNITYDFETLLPGQVDNDSYTSDEYHSKTHSYHFTSDVEYSPSIIRKVSDVADAELKLITLSAWIKPNSNNPDANIVVSIKDNSGKELFYEATSSNSLKDQFIKGEWKKLRAQFKLPFDKISADNFIVVYIWNRSKKDFYVDDLEIVYGEQHTRAGSEPQLNMSTLNKDGYAFERNKPPYKTSYLRKIDFGNSDSEKLVSLDQSSTITPNNVFFSGNFISNSKKLDQLVSIDQSNVRVYNYCENIKSFEEIFTGSVGSPFVLTKTSSIFSGDFDGDNVEELLVLNTSNKSYLIKIPAIQLCSISRKKISHLEISEITLPETILHKNNDFKICSGDYDGDGRCDIIMLSNDSSRFSYYHLEKNALVLSKSNAKPLKGDLKGEKINSISSIYLKDEMKACLQISWKENGKNISKLFSYNKFNGDLIPYNNSKSTSLFGMSYKNYSGNFLNQGGVEYLVYCRDWKFDLKLMGIDHNGFYVINNVDFSGFPLGKNPKYYECIKIVPGHFTSTQRKQILVVMRNCDCENYNGIDCSHFSKDKDFPSSIQLYSF